MNRSARLHGTDPRFQRSHRCGTARRNHRVERLIDRIVKATGDQDAALSAVGLTEIVHGIYRDSTPAIRSRRESFLNELF